MTKDMPNNSRETRLVMSGVLILTIANVLVKVFGFIYKVPLNAWLGDEMANINTAYAIYTILYLISTAGIPSGVAVLIAEHRARGEMRRVNAIFRVALLGLSVIGVLAMLFTYAFAGPISEWNSAGDSYLCMLTIAPALFFVCLSSVYRGYFQGFQIMKPTAVSEIIEAFGKMAIGLLIVYLSLNVAHASARSAAALSILGISVGMAVGTLYLAITKHIYQKKGMFYPLVDGIDPPPERGKKVLITILYIALPIMIASAMMNLSALVDSQLMRPLLENYYDSPELAKAIYSDYSTGAITLYNLPPVLVYPIALALVPYISSKIAQGDKHGVKRIAESAFRVCALISLPCAIGMSVLASPILSMIFSGDPEMAVHAGPLLRVLALAIFFVALLSITNALLQANHKQSKPIWSVLFGLIVKVVSSFWLISTFGEIGTPISTLLFFITVVSCNMFFVAKYVGVMPSILRCFLRPLLAAVVSGFVAGLSYALLDALLGNTVAVILAILFAVLVYLPLIFIFRCVTLDDIHLLPKGKAIGKLLIRLRLLKEPAEL